jgi:hypothetical protein
VPVAPRRHFGFGLSGSAEAKFRKSYLVLFFKKQRLSATWALPGVLPFRLPGHLQSFGSFLQKRPSGYKRLTGRRPWRLVTKFPWKCYEIPIL